MSYLASPEVCNPNEEKGSGLAHESVAGDGIFQTEGLACAAEAAAVLQVVQCEMLTLLRAIFHVIQHITLSCSSRNPG